MPHLNASQQCFLTFIGRCLTSTPHSSVSQPLLDDASPQPLGVLDGVEAKVKFSMGMQEPPSGESTTTEYGVNYQLLAVIY